jgi:hypothetical protein
MRATRFTKREPVVPPHPVDGVRKRKKHYAFRDLDGLATQQAIDVRDKKLRRKEMLKPEKGSAAYELQRIVRNKDNVLVGTEGAIEDRFVNVAHLKRAIVRSPAVRREIDEVIGILVDNVMLNTFPEACATELARFGIQHADGDPVLATEVKEFVSTTSKRSDGAPRALAIELITVALRDYLGPYVEDTITRFIDLAKSKQLVGEEGLKKRRIRPSKKHKG